MNAPSLLLLRALLAAVLADHVVCSNNMNPRPYVIANLDPRSSQPFSTDLSKKSEFFDVYSPPIKTLYSQVYWAMQDPVRLPEEIIERFQDKVMAITGYEVDQVRQHQATGPDGEAVETSVPITWAYNHHYMAWIEHHSEELAAEKRENYRNHAYQWSAPANPQGFSKSEFFSEGNGGEFRSSFHGYPAGYAQLVFSPDTFFLNPMQIDTWNRTSTTALYQPGPLPASSQIPTTSGYSGLIECPCSNRMTKQWGMTYGLSAHDDDANKCQGGAIANATECLLAAKMVVPSDHYKLVTDDHDPDNDDNNDKAMTQHSCSVTQHLDGSVDVFWKETTEEVEEDHRVQQQQQDDESSPSVVAFGSGLVNVTVTLNDQEATIRLTGPANVWFGVGFGASSMCEHPVADECPTGGPYAVIVSDADIVVERKLDQHGPGHVLDSSFSSVQWIDDEHKHHRTVLLTRPLAGLTDEHYTFDPSQTTPLDMIDARGCSLKFAQHCEHGSNRLFFVQADTETPLCRTGIQGSIYGQPFAKDRCAAEPTSDLRRQHNPTCTVQQYRGGLSCCHHLTSLLDKEQEIPWKDEYLTYRLKFRFYFEEYQPATAAQPSSHEHLTRIYWQTEAFAGEYDIPPCATDTTPPDQCVHTITSRFQVHQAMDLHSHGKNHEMEKDTMVKLIYAGPHCHAPTCLSMDLYNADTGELLCHVEPIRGQTGDVFDEKGFLAIPPCLWGSPNEGLVPPKLLSLDTTLLSIKRNNNTLPHTGEMASWQMRGVVVRPSAAAAASSSGNSDSSIKEPKTALKEDDKRNFELSSQSVVVEEERFVVQESGSSSGKKQFVRGRPAAEPDE